MCERQMDSGSSHFSLSLFYISREKGLGELDVVFDAKGNVVSCDGSIRFPYDNTVYEPADALDETFVTRFTEYLGNFSTLIPTMSDEDMATIVNQYELEIAAFGDEVIATVPDDICYERIPGQGRSLICTPEETLAQGGGVCNLVAKAFLDQAPSADVVIQNAGGCRADIGAGEYRVNDAFTLLPFANTLVSLEMTGSEIVQVLNVAAVMALSGISTGAYPYASGLRYDVDGTNMDVPVANVEVNVRLEGNWTPIDEDTVYTVVTNSFIATGGDGYTTFTEIEDVTDLYMEYANTFIRYCEKVKTLVDPPLMDYSTQSFIPREETDAPTTTTTLDDVAEMPSEYPIEIGNNMTDSQEDDPISDVPASDETMPPPTQDSPATDSDVSLSVVLSFSLGLAYTMMLVNER
jgi:5'-nucleotidase / UDP-sugar diphosphatase